MAKCGKCGDIKILRGNQLRCRRCQIAAQKKHYYKNQIIEISKRRSRVNEITKKHLDLINSIKDVPCADCGNKYPSYVMDFDHVNGSKRENVARMLSYSTESLLAEIKKCEIVCSNCHRIRTYTRRSSSIKVSMSAFQAEDEDSISS